MSDRQVQVLRFLKVCEVPPTAREVADALDLSSSTAHNVLKRLEELDQVERAGVAMTGGRCWRALR